MSLLDARLIPGGIWKGAAVQVSPDRRPRPLWVGDAVCLKRVDADLWLVYGDAYTRNDSTAIVPLSELSLVLPGDEGGNAHRLLQRVKARLSKDGRLPVGYGASGPAAELVSQLAEAAFTGADALPEVAARLAMMDAMAAKLGWPTGPGAPVYGWRGTTLERDAWELTWPGHIFHRYLGRRIPALKGITDPMEALKAVWLSECVS